MSIACIGLLARTRIAPLANDISSSHKPSLSWHLAVSNQRSIEVAVLSHLCLHSPTRTVAAPSPMREITCCENMYTYVRIHPNRSHSCIVRMNSCMVVALSIIQTFSETACIGRIEKLSAVSIGTPRNVVGMISYDITASQMFFSTAGITAPEDT